MKQEIDNNLLVNCIKSATKEKLLDKDWEVELWAYALYNATMWGKMVK